MSDIERALEAERRIINAASAEGAVESEQMRAVDAEGALYLTGEYEIVLTRGEGDWDHLAVFEQKEHADLFMHSLTALPLRSAQVEAVLAKCDEITKDGEELMAEWHERGEESDEIELLSQGADLVEMARVIRRAIEEAAS